MRKKNNKYLVLILLTIVLPAFLWLLSFPNTTIEHNAYPIVVYSSQLFAVIGFSLFALTFVLSTRFQWIEKHLGGLDKEYHLHRTVGKSAFFIVLIHPVLLALRWLPDDTEKTLTYLLPFHRKLEINLGSWALLGISILIVFTLVINLAYDKWKLSHKFMGVFYILGIAHVFLIKDFFPENPALAVYFVIISILGTAAYLYKTIFIKWLVKKHPFKVEKIDELSDEVMEITLRNDSIDFDFTPGQFCFFQFVSNDISMESHPFTICSTSKSGSITILVKSLGDYTNALHDKLRISTPALLEGPYGCFDYQVGKEKQIWIAGGVGIAPFISWCRDLEANSKPDLKVEFYYCVKNSSAAFHLHEFEKLEKEIPEFNVHLFCSDTAGFIQGSDFTDLKDRTIFMCGPKEMRNALLMDFKAIGVPKNNIIYEDFDFL